MKKKKPTVSPEAAKILEQYRNAGKPQPEQTADGSATPGGGGAARANTPAPPGSAKIQRSGSRGK